MAGIKITLRDPVDDTKVYHAEFATARSFPVLKEKLKNIAMLDAHETMVARGSDIAQVAISEAKTPDALASAGEAYKVAQGLLSDAGSAMIEALFDFVVSGYELAGSPRDLAEKLADMTPIERLHELKSRCLFGGGVVDFTKGAAQ